MKTLQRGFTLIELLVVIAIIGILSSIVLASLSSARQKGEDAAIQTTLSNMRAQAELYYSSFGTYGPALTEAVCPTAGVTGNLASTIFSPTTSQGGLWALVSGLNTRATNANTICSVETNGTAWAAAAVLKGDTTKAYCVDSTGAAKTYTGTAANAVTASVCQ